MYVNPKNRAITVGMSECETLGEACNITAIMAAVPHPVVGIAQRAENARNALQELLSVVTAGEQQPMDMGE